MKKFITSVPKKFCRCSRLALLALFLCCLLPMTALASVEQDSPLEDTSSAVKIAVSSATAYQGDVIGIRISIANSPGLAGIKLSLSFDKNRLTVAKDAQGNCRFDAGYAAQTGSLDVNETKSGCTVMWYHTENVQRNGTLATVYFYVEKTAKAGNCPISITLMDICDAAGKDISAAFTNGAVTIQLKQTVENDLNGDGAVDALDLDVLYRYLSTGSMGGVDIGDFDINGDTAVNILDYQTLYDLILAQVAKNQ